MGDSEVRMVNVLLSSAGRRVELTRCFQQAYRTLGLQGRVVAIDVDPLAPTLQVADRYYLVPRLTSPEYLPALLEICRREEISAVFPLIDPDIAFLARHRAEISRTGARLAVVPDAAVDTINDKWRTTRFFQELGLRTPRSWLPRDCDLERMDYPVFIKPRNGSAAKHAFRVENERELRFFVEYVPDPIVQEHLDGPEITSDIACGFDGEVLGVVSRMRLEVRTGEVSKGVTVNNPAILDACASIARALPAIGPVTVQCMMHRGEPYFTEINARFGGGVPLGIAAGVDAPRLLLAQLAGIPVERPALGGFETGLCMTRFDDSFLITETERERMASRRI